MSILPLKQGLACSFFKNDIYEQQNRQLTEPIQQTTPPQYKSRFRLKIESKTAFILRGQF
jgi:hypothetical protein